MGDPTLLFCTGATKAGTSWLHRYLSDHPQCHFRAIKELHYFNAFDFDERAKQRQAIEAHREWLIGRTSRTNSEARFANVIRMLGHYEHWLSVLDLEHEDPQAYLDYLMGGLEGERVVGDMTPAYSLLSVERLRMMANLTADVRFIYLLRDPVDRLWSHIRMVAKRRGEGDVHAKANNIFARWLSGDEEQIDLRCDYRGALERLKAAVTSEKRLVMFYEELFSAPGLERVCAFLDIETVPGAFDVKVLEGDQLAMDAAQRAAARERLADQYEFVEKVFGRLPEAWRESEKV